MIKKKTTYKDSGVDIKKGDALVHSISDMVNETHNASVLSDIGGFGGFFKPEIQSYSDPVFVSSVDGVGTKLIVAFKTQIFDTIGQDLVNHCVNDIAVCGANPLFFLDYFSTGNLDKNVAFKVLKGFTAACKANGVALIGGETAEMPDIYQQDEFDLAGTIVGMVGQQEIIDGKKITKGDLLLGFPSSGLHTNGYSLARKVLFSAFKVNDYVDELSQPLGEELLQVHKSYLPLIKKIRQLDGVHGFSHITGGGIAGNTKRILPDDRSLQINWEGWERPPVFNLIQDIGSVPEADMRATFNLGIGLIAIISPAQKSAIINAAETMETTPVVIGRVA